MQVQIELGELEKSWRDDHVSTLLLSWAYFGRACSLNLSSFGEYIFKVGCCFLIRGCCHFCGGFERVSILLLASLCH